MLACFEIKSFSPLQSGPQGPQGRPGVGVVGPMGPPGGGGSRTTLNPKPYQFPYLVHLNPKP